MNVALITPWENAWIPYFKQAFEARGHKFTALKHGLPAEWDQDDLSHTSMPKPMDYDVVLHGWASGDSQPFRGAKNIVFMRRYELFDGGLSRVNWKGVSDLICVNSWIKDVAEGVLKGNGIETKVHLIYNGTDPKMWRYKERAPGKKIGMACHVHPKKNLPLAAQILGLLPDGYELHIAGQIQDPCTAEYLNHLGTVMKRRIYLYGHIPAGSLSLWWDQMNYCLSTSISEGNPNNVIEAMAKGIKPVVHNWPGAEDQFPEDMRFSTAEEAARQIMSAEYISSRYLRIVQEKFSLANIERVVDLALA